MHHVYIRELSFYDTNQLANKLEVDIDVAIQCIEVLTARGVMKLKTSEELKEYDNFDYTNNKGKYQFIYVGLVIFQDIVIIVYPKYFKTDIPDTKTMKQIFKVIRKSSGSLSEIAAISEEGVKSNDRLTLMLSLLEMYGEYGIYSNTQQEYKTNGQGEISWDKTIERHIPFMNESDFVYLNHETIVTVQDQSDFMMRLQKCILTLCSNFMEESGLSDLLALDVIELSDERLEDFGDAIFINYKIEQEMGVQFVTWKQELLKLLQRFVADDEVLVQSDEVVCFGTSSFYHIWEKGCKVAFGDLLNKPLGYLGLPLNRYWTARKKETLLSIVPRPIWQKYSDGQYEECGNVSTLIPDTVTFWKDNNGRNVFAIIDAKYYTPMLDAKPSGVPGVESVTKQYLYQAAYKRFVLDNGFNQVINAFYVPANNDFIQLLGRVEFPGMFEEGLAPFTNDVTMWALPAKDVWDCYLSGCAIGEDFISQLLT